MAHTFDSRRPNYREAGQSLDRCRSRQATFFPGHKEALAAEHAGWGARDIACFDPTFHERGPASSPALIPVAVQPRYDATDAQQL